MHTLCLADRYGIEELADNCFLKLHLFPIGTDHLTLLAEEVMDNIPKARSSIYAFVRKHMRLHRHYLSDCEAFNQFVKRETSSKGQGMLELIADTTAQANYIPRALNNGDSMVFCRVSVSAEELNEQYGSDSSYPIKFGSAKFGEIFLSDDIIQKRGLIVVSVERDGSQLAFPSHCFQNLDGTAFKTIDRVQSSCETGCP